MVCDKCKSILPDDSEFCQFCGNRIEAHKEQTSKLEPVASPIRTATVSPVTEKPVPVRTAERNTGKVHPNEPAVQTTRKKAKVLPIILAIALSLSIIGNIAQFFFHSYHTEEIREQLAVAKDTIADRDESITSYKNKISSQTTTINQQKTEISNLKDKGSYFDDIVSDMRYGNAGYASSNFFASDSVIVVGKNDTDCKFTLTANWSNGGTVEVEYSSSAAWVSFDNDEWYTSTKMTVHPRSKGVTVVTFSNDVDSKTFKVLIIVTD